ncbi:MAG TPA: polysaccharide biosynthesis protein [Candidatus Limnocylindria bacterium]|nr:polysaccharide biosynthesis protein [Candidatus Limnocylindria bacterium]
MSQAAKAPDVPIPDGDAPEERRDRRDGPGDPAAPARAAELAAPGPVRGEVLGLAVRERRSLVFSPPPAGAPFPRGMAADGQVEPFRELRTRLLMSAGKEGMTRFTTLVVPVTAGSGASFVARNLAAAFTLQQRLALVVDCNFRHATQHEALGVDGGEGLADHLARPADVPLERIVRPTAVPGLHVIPAGSDARGAAAGRRELASSPALRALLARLRDEPCDVFLDGPPVEGSPDARLLADLADFVVLVVGYGRTTAAAVAQAAAAFDRRTFAGVVFNDGPDDLPGGRLPGAR